MRSGDEPAHARSPLRLRLALAGFGGLLAVAWLVLSLIAGSAIGVACAAALGVIAGTNITVVVYRIRQGPHFQPGPDVPPYQPVPPYRPVPPAPRPGVGGLGRTGRATPEAVRQRRYFVLMGLCLTLLLVAWLVVRLYSTTATVILTVIAMVIPPVAAIVANAGARLGPPDRQRRDGDGGPAPP